VLIETEAPPVQAVQETESLTIAEVVAEPGVVEKETVVVNKKLAPPPAPAPAPAPTAGPALTAGPAAAVAAQLAVTAAAVAVDIADKAEKAVVVVVAAAAAATSAVVACQVTRRMSQILEAEIPAPKAPGVAIPVETVEEVVVQSAPPAAPRAVEKPKPVAKPVVVEEEVVKEVRKKQPVVEEEERTRRVRTVEVKVPEARKTAAVQDPVSAKVKTPRAKAAEEADESARIRLMTVEREMYQEVMVIEAEEMAKVEWVGDPTSKAEVLLREYWAYWEANKCLLHSEGKGASVGMTFTTTKVRKPNFEELSEALLLEFQMFWAANKVNNWNSRASVNSVISSASESFMKKQQARERQKKEKKEVALRRRKEAKERLVGMRQSGNAAIILTIEKKNFEGEGAGSEPFAFPAIESPTKREREPQAAREERTLPTVLPRHTPPAKQQEPWCNWCKTWHSKEKHAAGCGCGCCSRLTKYEYEQQAKDLDKPVHRRLSSLSIPRIQNTTGTRMQTTPARSRAQTAGQTSGRRTRTVRAKARTPTAKGTRSARDGGGVGGVGGGDGSIAFRSVEDRVLVQSRSEPRKVRRRNQVVSPMDRQLERQRVGVRRLSSAASSVAGSSTRSATPSPVSERRRLRELTDTIETGSTGYTRHANTDSPELKFEVDFDRSSADAAVYNIQWFRSFSQLAEDASRAGVAFAPDRLGVGAALPDLLLRHTVQAHSGGGDGGSRSSSRSPSPYSPARRLRAGMPDQHLGTFAPSSSAKSLLSPTSFYQQANRSSPSPTAHTRLLAKVDKLNGVSSIASSRYLGARGAPLRGV
jgi:hypothetical protein